MSAICFEQVSLKFRGASYPAVNGVSCEIEAGQLVVILGLSGCGKTTLLKMVNRLYEPTSGTIYLDGKDIRDIKVTKLRQQIGYVIQQSGLFPHMSVAQNIAVVPKLLGWTRTEYQARVDELLTLVELPPELYRNRYPAQLSGGQQQRVGVARALAGDPKVMLMDEPFGAIDAITRQTLQDEILRLQRQLKKTILFVSHDVEEALRLADKIMILQKGQIVQFDTPFNILTQPANAFVHELMGGDDMLRQLSLLRVETAMSRVSQDNQLTRECAIAPQDNLRQALSLLLGTSAERLIVVDDGTVVGVITLEDIRDSARMGER
ncbi:MULTISPECIES: ABC transporter ATP-binding protein [unclassified Coleofasciculus]|uniref:ABC transporter ATP-binding protein n=1 Tax=unclassified Coleofasciculus TaxID=2692782 RepID=UPI00187F5319|nr:MULTISPECIES: ABC transporter ATP-binding protein [unclassified Coleofasciculus]MBE9127763.1 ABC transporter ATP-binding protein [Coleofasciculus sp. LEGE 07081]MBE9149463.1 ABC transporter ATP-binding protein [Coleofasciculus sp. LEGE 07092]